jgi:hypothetical protein
MSWIRCSEVLAGGAPSWRRSVVGSEWAYGSFATVFTGLLHLEHHNFVSQLAIQDALRGEDEMVDSQILPDKREGYVDRFGAFASAACAVHCSVSALLPAAFAALGLGFLVGHETEWVLTLVAVSFGVVAFAVGWRRHRKILVFAMLAIGVSGLLAARVIEGEGHHHGHEPHAAQGEHGEHVVGAGSGHHDEGDHDSHGQGFGEGLGIAAGLILMMGHITNLQEVQRAKDAAEDDTCCDDKV